MSVNSSNIETWKEVLLALQSMFDDKLELETIQKFFDENEQDIERTVDAILVYLTNKAVNGEKFLENELKEEERQSDTSDDEDSFEREFEHIKEEEEERSDIDDNEEVVQESQVSITQEIDKSSPSSSSYVDDVPSLIEQYPTVDLGLSEVSAEVSLAQSQEQYIQVESIIESSPSIAESSQSASSLQAQIDELTLQLSEATLAKQKVEEEKKHAMKWCLAEMQKLRDEVKEKEEVNNSLQSEIELLRKQLQDKNSNKLDKFITESKQMLAEGVQSLSEQINAGVNRVQSEFKDNEKDWVFVDRLKEFASEFKKELLELFKDPLPRNPFSVTKKTNNVVTKKSEEEVEDEERELWKTEKASLESYVKELENRIRMYQEEERIRALHEESSQSVSTSTSDSQLNSENPVSNNNNNNVNNNYYPPHPFPQPPVFAWPLQYNPWSGIPQNQWNGNQR